ncbi:hypothetical protein NKH10_26600 [Mesorhizobium sp. M1340]|uniref:hypothetical protein n=1 Tax=Mesorhizobium sp. M1340 TaxID=2957087 RepID=UPI0033372F31
MQVEVQVGVPGALLSKMKEGNIELVLGSQCEGEEMGRLLWREPLVWAWAAQTGVALPDPLLLAVLPEPCPYRQVALERLPKAGISSAHPASPDRISQRTVLICTSNASLKAAAISGFAVAPMIASQLRNGLVRVPKSYGLPATRSGVQAICRTERSSKNWPRRSRTPFLEGTLAGSNPKLALTSAFMASLEYPEMSDGAGRRLNHAQTFDLHFNRVLVRGRPSKPHWCR